MEIRKIKMRLFEEIMRNAIIVLCIVTAAFQMIRGELSLGGLAALFTTLFSLIFILSNLIRNMGAVFSLMYSVQQFYKLANIRGRDRNEEKEEPCLENEGFCFEFRNVSYRYPLTEKYVLHNLNLEIKDGQHIAVVGENGSGKTTFIKLLLGLLEASEGKIIYHGVDRNKIDQSRYMKNFSAVFQDYAKYKDTLRYNVSISETENRKNDLKLEKALAEAEFNKDIDFDCMLSKEFGGIELSGGEWQKVALARAMFCDSNILVLDEPTSAIDPMHEAKLYKRFAEMSRGKTSIFVTHRLGSVLQSDLVLFFQEGKIIEAGSHDELLLKKGQYYKFWTAQTGLYHL